MIELSKPYVVPYERAIVSDAFLMSGRGRERSLRPAPRGAYDAGVSHVDALVSEYLDLGAHGRRAAYYEVQEERGTVEFCGTPTSATLTFVRAGALVLLAVGTREHTVERYEAMKRARAPYAELEPASLMWGGQRRGFRPLGGAQLVGAVERDAEAVIFLVVDERAVLVLVQGKHKRVVMASAWNAMGVPDVDSLAVLQGGRRGRDGETVGRTCAALFALGARALEVGASSRLRGSTTIAAFTALLAELVRAGCGDLCGWVSTILRSIQQYRPNTDLSSEQLSDALTLLYSTGTVLVERPTARTWAIRLGEVQRTLARSFLAEGVAVVPIQPSSHSFRRRRRAVDEQLEGQGPPARRRVEQEGQGPPAPPVSPEAPTVREDTSDWRSVLKDTASKVPG